MDGRYAAEKETGVMGDGGGGSRSKEGDILAIWKVVHESLVMRCVWTS